MRVGREAPRRPQELRRLALAHWRLGPAAAPAPPRAAPRRKCLSPLRSSYACLAIHYHAYSSSVRAEDTAPVQDFIGSAPERPSCYGSTAPSPPVMPAVLVISAALAAPPTRRVNTNRSASWAAGSTVPLPWRQSTELGNVSMKLMRRKPRGPL
jgi:hypothetical protein